MNDLSRWVRACLLALLILPTRTVGAEPQKAAPPDVVLITLDTLRADHVGCYGDASILTPTLDSLAHDGVRFTNAFTPSPLTNTSHASIMTARLPSAHGVTDFGVPLPAALPTWAALLKARGYATAAFIGAVILDSKGLAPGLDRGFDTYDNFPPSAAHIASRYGRVERRAAEVVHHAESWLRAHPKGPRFVWVHLYDPHDPYDPPEPYRSRYRGHLYDGEIAYADHALGGLLEFLRKQGRYNNTIIIAVGDHGEGLGEHGEDTHGIFLYDSTLHVPLIIKSPGGNSGGLVKKQVRTTDILPTVLALTGDAPKDMKFDGASLLPLLMGANTDTLDETAFGETDYPLRFGWAPLKSVRQEGFKYIEAPRPELYDLRADPGETENIYEPWSAKVKELRPRVAALRETSSQARGAGAVDPHTIEELKALGYLGYDPGSTTAAEPSLLPDPKDRIGVQNLLHNAMLREEDGDLTSARISLARALEQEPESGAAWLQLGEVESKLGNYREAASALEHARKLRPADASAALHLGQALFHLADYAAARDALEASLKLVPGQFSARCLLGDVYAALGQKAAAEDQYEAAILLDGRKADVRESLASLFMQERTYAAAAEQLEVAASLEPKNAEIAEKLAAAYAAMGDPARAAKEKSRAVRLRAKSPH